MWQKVDRVQDNGGLWGEIPIHHRYTAGVAGQRFFRAMKEDRQLLAARCPSCLKSFLPPKLYCEVCFERTNDWQEVRGPGYVRSFTQLYLSLDEGPLERPQMIGLIGWEGIEGGLVHMIQPGEGDGAFVGMPVEPVWADQRTGQITDILYFQGVGDVR